MFRFLKCCCEIICPPCPFPFANKRGWTKKPIPTCPECPKCPPCPVPFQDSRGWFGTPISGCPPCPECPPCPPPFAAYRGWTGSPITHCYQCPPPCENNPCLITKSVGEVCECLATRFLVVATALTDGCSGQCKTFSCPPGFTFDQHFRTQFADYSGAYCWVVGAPTDDPILGNIIGTFPHEAYAGDGLPIADCDNSTLVDFGTNTFLRLAVAYGGGGVHVEATVLGATNSGNLWQIFHKLIHGQSCEGPWILYNELDGCEVDCATGALYSANPLAMLAIYPCAC